ncbi:MAG: hypothetical protein JNL37_14510 [Thauera sp.]|nr:hypothetical protein [Thauera sp.]
MASVPHPLAARPTRRADRNCGQALVLGLFFLFATAAVLLLMFNTGRTTDEKMRLTNAADAVAWSVATVEARALNYDAYTNRAIVANEVAVAQAISLISWMHYFETAVENSPTLNQVASSWLYKPGEYLRLLQLLAGVNGTAYLAVGSGGSLRAIVESLDAALGAITTTHDAVAGTLAASQQIMHASLDTGITQTGLANKLVHRIDPDMLAAVNPISHDFRRLTRAMAKDSPQGDERGRVADVTLRSRDAFTRERVWSIRGLNLPPLQRKVELKRRGGTELIGYDEWRALDTLEHEGQRMKRWRWRWRRTPLAWAGASAAHEAETEAGRGHHGNTYASNPLTTLHLAEPSLATTGKATTRFGGLPETRELRELSPAADQRSGVTVRVAKARDRMRSSGGTGSVQPNGALRMFEADAPGGQLAAMARAEVFFERPAPRSDRKAERASLYSPYWHARLTAVTAVDRGWAAAQQDGMVLP